MMSSVQTPHRTEAAQPSGAITYELQRSARRRTLSIVVKDTGNVKVYAPASMAEAKIHAFVLEKSDWIARHVSRIRQRIQHPLPDYADGCECLFMGRRFPLRLSMTEAARPRIDFLGQAWRVSLPKDSLDPKEMVKSLLEDWYRREAREFLAGRLLQWARRMDLEVDEICVRTQKRLWGCCYPRKKKIHLNWLIIKAPVEAIDYVIVHELCHLWVPNHSVKFWKRVAEFFPGYPEQQRWFKNHGFELR